MKLTERELRKIIREELSRLNENDEEKYVLQVDNTDSAGYFHGKGSRNPFGYTVKSTTKGFDSREKAAKRAEKRGFGENGYYIVEAGTDDFVIYRRPQKGYFSGLKSYSDRSAIPQYSRYPKDRFESKKEAERFAKDKLGLFDDEIVKIGKEWRFSELYADDVKTSKK